MIGYGNSVTEVTNVDRRSSDGLLVLAMRSDEPEFSDNLPASSGHSHIVAYDPTGDTYNWFKVISET